MLCLSSYRNTYIKNFDEHLTNVLEFVQTEGTSLCQQLKCKMYIYISTRIFERGAVNGVVKLFLFVNFSNQFDLKVNFNLIFLD